MRRTDKKRNADAVVAELVEAVIEELAEKQAALDEAQLLIDYQYAELRAYHREEADAAYYEAQLEAASRQPVAMNWALASVINLKVNGIPIRVMVNTKGRQTTRVTTHHISGAPALTEDKTTASALVECDLPLVGTLHGKARIVSTAVSTGLVIDETNCMEIDIPLGDWRNRHLSVYASARVSTDGKTVTVKTLNAPDATVNASQATLTDLAVE